MFLEEFSSGKDDFFNLDKILRFWVFRIYLKVGNFMEF